jgi:4-phosphopantoate--beta-alanine ligase
MADITIVDNIIRAIPNMIKFANELSSYSEKELKEIVSEYDNRMMLSMAIKKMRDYLTEMAEEIFKGGI